MWFSSRVGLKFDLSRASNTWVCSLHGLAVLEGMVLDDCSDDKSNEQLHLYQIVSGLSWLPEPEKSW